MAAGDLPGVELANADAAAWTTAVAAAVVAALFGEHAQAYQALTAHVAAFHDQFVQTLSAAAGSYLAGGGPRSG